MTISRQIFFNREIYYQISTYLTDREKIGMKSVHPELKLLQSMKFCEDVFSKERGHYRKSGDSQYTQTRHIYEKNKLSFKMFSTYAAAPIKRQETNEKIVILLSDDFPPFTCMCENISLRGIFFDAEPVPCAKLVKRMWSNSQFDQSTQIMDAASLSEQFREPVRVRAYVEALVNLVKEGMEEQAISAFSTLEPLEKNQLTKLLYELVDFYGYDLPLRMLLEGCSDVQRQTMALQLLIDRALKYGHFSKASEIARVMPLSNESEEMISCVDRAHIFYTSMFKEFLDRDEIVKATHALNEMQRQRCDPFLVSLAYNWLAQYASAAGYYSIRDGVGEFDIILHDLGFNRFGLEHPKFEKPSFFRRDPMEIEQYLSSFDSRKAPLFPFGIQRVADRQAFLLSMVEMGLGGRFSKQALVLMSHIQLPFYRMIAERKMRQSEIYFQEKV